MSGQGSGKVNNLAKTLKSSESLLNLTVELRITYLYYIDNYEIIK